MSKPLKPQHLIFIEAYLSNGYSIVNAYEAAYPNATRATCYVNGARLMKTERIQEHLQKRMDSIIGTPAEMRKKLLIELTDMAFAQKDDEYYVPSVKHKAIDTLNKMSGAYTEKIEITNKTILVTLEDDEDDEPTDRD